MEKNVSNTTRHEELVSRNGMVRRWQEAQKAELAWWDRWQDLYFYRNHSFKNYWATRVHAFGINHGDCTGKRIVEVGCGPHGVVGYLFPNALKIGIDPLINRYKERAQPIGNTLLVTGMGETLPILDDSVDLAFCINVIDHVLNPKMVVQEIRRVLKKSGELVLEAHTFPPALIPFMFMDKPHTYHWSVKEMVSLVDTHHFKILRVEQLDFDVKLSWKSYFRPKDWKYILGKMCMKLTYVHAVKR